MRALFFATILAITTTSSAQTPCHASASAEHQVTAAQAAALEFQAISSDSGVQAKVAPRLIKLKDSLASLLDAELGCHSVTEPVSQLQHRINTLLLAAAPGLPEPPPTTNQDDAEKPLPGVYGNEVAAHLEITSGPPQLLEVTIESSVPCGSDSQLLIYEANGNHWKRALRWSSRFEIGEVGDLSPDIFGDFFLTKILTISGSPQSEWSVVVAHGTPWCSSRFSNFGLAVIAPTSDGAGRLVWQTERDYSRGDAEVRLKAAGNTFDFRLNADAMWFDPDYGYERPVIYRYRVSSSKVTRLQPVAANGRGFVEEWLSMPWEEALSQSTHNPPAELEKIHQFYRQKEPENSFTTWHAGPVHACSPAGEFQVNFDTWREYIVPNKPDGKEGPTTSHYFHIHQLQNGYEMLSVSPNPDPMCTGPDLMAKPPNPNR